MTNRMEMNRRQFVVTTAAIGGGMAIGFGPGGFTRQGLAAEGDVEVDPWLVIGKDGSLTVRVSKTEIGTGVQTTIPMFICEELNCDWSRMNVEYADVNRDYRDNKVYSQKVGSLAWFGGRSADIRVMMQQIAASTRERLKAAAAADWSVPVASLTVKNHEVVHEASGRKAGFGTLAAKAATIKLAEEPKIKTPDQWAMVGTPMSKRETPMKVNGSATFGIDVRLPGMVYAAVKQAPAQGGRVKSHNADAVKGMPGVQQVIVIQPQATNTNNRLQGAVAVVADTFWHAKSALDVLPVEWEAGPGGNTSTESIRADFLKALDQTGQVATTKGDALGAMKTATKVVEAVYETPYADHALMEPFSGTAQITADRADVWVSTQMQNVALEVTAEETGLAQSKVYFHPTFVGGGFGRRTVNDETRLTVAIAKQLQGKPVKVMWTREESMRQGRYRPMAMSKFQCGIGADGWPVAWFNRHVSHSSAQQYDPVGFKGLDSSALRTLSVDNEYSIPNTLVEYHAKQTNILTGPWRGPGANQNAFKIESFVDEVAFASGKDPVALRRWLLRDAKDPGWLKVLNEVATKSEWGKPLPKGTAQGIAICLDHGTIIAEVATVTVSQDGAVKVHQVDVAFDLGTILNPDGVKNQMEGGIIMGLNMAMNEEITVRQGRVVEGNYDDYPMLRIDQAPVIKVHFGGLTGGTKFTPAGEPPTPPVPPAVGNAIFRATGKRVRSLPFRNHDLSWS